MNQEQLITNSGQIVEPKKGLDSNTLKYIAIIAMTIDHIGWAFFEHGSPTAILLHFIGRTTGPIMFYSAVEGFHHTKNINKYMLRLAVFAVISYFPFVYFNAGGNLLDLSFTSPSVIYNIFMGVTAVRIRRGNFHPALKVVSILALIVLCIPADWGTWGIIIILVFDFYYGSFKNQAFGYILVIMLEMGLLSLLTRPFFGLFYGDGFVLDYEHYRFSLENLGLFIPIILLSFYNGQKGKGGKLSKWIFYIYYPLHLLIIGFAASVLKK